MIILIKQRLLTAKRVFEVQLKYFIRLICIGLSLKSVDKKL